MNNMRRGFTMIELIFVIVIIGILAAVAIPKLAATRDDAKISNIVANARTVVGDMSAFYTSQGQSGWDSASATSQKIADVTNVPLASACSATAETSAADDDIAAHAGLFLCDGDGNICVEFETTADGNLTAKQGGGASTGNICPHVVADPAVAAMTNGTVGKITTLGGVGVKR